MPGKKKFLQSRKGKISKRIAIILLILVGYNFFFMGKITMHETVTIARGNTFGKFTRDLGRWTNTKFKVYTKLHGSNVNDLKEGSYALSGTYSFGDFVTQIAKGPTQEYIRYTVLEGWSLYDIDTDLAKKGYIQTGEYVKYVSDYGTLSELMQGFEFLRQFEKLNNLEGFLYPDTYFVDVGKPFVDQLVKQQLRAFDSKVWQKMNGDITNFNNKLNLNGINLTNLTMTPYKILTLASVVEKEERSSKNKPTVAGIFLKRLQIGMRLDADITLCYGLKQGYEDCTPAIIAKNIDDTKNVYNTRVKGGLPPQPIANPSATTIDAVLNFQSSTYLFYLHGADGQIHYGKTVSEHNANKNMYLK